MIKVKLKKDCVPQKFRKQTKKMNNLELKKSQKVW